MGTPSFAAATGVTPDFSWNPATTGNLLTPCGSVCWGAPGSGTPPDAATWPASNPNCYVNCVAYGGATAPSGPNCPVGNTQWDITEATALAPGDGTQSLTRGA